MVAYLNSVKDVMSLPLCYWYEELLLLGKGEGVKRVVIWAMRGLDG